MERPNESVFVVVTTETGRVFFRRRTKQLPLVKNENILGHVDRSRQTHMTTFLRAVCGSVPSLSFSNALLLMISR